MIITPEIVSLFEGKKLTLANIFNLYPEIEQYRLKTKKTVQDTIIENESVHNFLSGKYTKTQVLEEFSKTIDNIYKDHENEILDFDLEDDYLEVYILKEIDVLENNENLCARFRSAITRYKENLKKEQEKMDVIDAILKDEKMLEIIKEKLKDQK